MGLNLELGVKAQDKFSGFKGTVTALCNYLTSNNRVQITPSGMDKDGKPNQSQWFDIAQIEVIAE